MIRPHPRLVSRKHFQAQLIMIKLFYLFFSLCLSLLVWESIQNVSKYLQHPTAQRLSSTNLAQGDFPKIEVCLTPGFDLDYLKSNGYDTITNFAAGRMEHEGGVLYGWNGNKSSKQFLEDSVTFKTWEDVIFKYILTLGNTNIGSSVKILERKYLFPNGKCFDLKIKLNKLDDDLSIDKETVLTLIFKDQNDLEIKVKISDPHREYFLSDDFTFYGQEVKKKLNATTRNSMDLYKLKIKENIGDEKDPEAHCKEYDEKDSFKECVKKAVEEKLLKVYGCMPPWFTDNIDDVCNGIFSDEKWKNIFNDIFRIMDQSFLKVCTDFHNLKISFYKHTIFQECKVPCKTMEIESRKLREFETRRKGVKIIFDPNVHVARSEPTMSTMNLFSNIGGVVGLTLGYSLLQVVMYLIQYCKETTALIKG